MNSSKFVKFKTLCMKIFFISILIFVISYVKSQQLIIYNDIKPETYLVKDEPGDKNTPLRNILKTLAQGNNKPIPATKFYFAYKQKSRIMKKNNTLEFIVEIQDINFSGDLNYKGFPMSEFLFPNEADFSINWLSRSGQIIKTFNFTNVQINEDNLVLADFYENDTLMQNSYKIEVVNKNFYYTVVNMKLVKSKADLIDEYYTIDNQMKYAFAELETVNPDNIDKLYEYNSIINKNDILISSITAKDFINQLNLENYDPIKLDEKLSNLYGLNNQLKYEIKYNLEHLYEIYYHRGLEFLANGKTELALQNFNKSVNSNLFFAPAHYQIAKINYYRKNYDLAVTGILDIVNNMNPDPNTRELAVELANMVYADLISIAKNYNSQNKFELALSSLDKAKNICQSVTGMICSTELQTAYQESINGKYQQYISNANQQIDAGKLFDAENLIQTLRVYYQSNTGLLDVNYLDKVIEKLYFAYIEKSKKLNASGNYTDAVKCVDNASQICKTNSKIQCTNDLEEQVLIAYKGIYAVKIESAKTSLLKNDLKSTEQNLNDAELYRSSKNLDKNPLYDDLMFQLNSKKYQSLISESHDLFANKKYENCLAKIKEAEKIAVSSSIAISNDVKKLKENSARNQIVKLIQNGTDAVETNNLKIARDNYKDASALVSEYSLENDKEISASLNALKGKMFSQECKNALNEYQTQYNLVLSYCDKKEFDDADRAMEKAFQIADKNSDCDINTDEAKNKRSAILPAITYQKLFADIEKMLREGKYEQLYKKFQDLEMYYFEFKVDKFGLEHLTLTDYILKCNSEFVNYSIKYYAEKNDLSNSLKFLDELFKRNYSPKWCSQNQEFLAAELAKRDFANNSSANPKEVVTKYTKGEKWYSILKKSYLKQWKTLK